MRSQINANSEIQIFKWYLNKAVFQFQQNIFLLKYIQIKYRKKQKKINKFQVNLKKLFDDSI